MSSTARLSRRRGSRLYNFEPALPAVSSGDWRIEGSSYRYHSDSARIRMPKTYKYSVNKCPTNAQRRNIQSDHGIDYRETSIERQLRYLGCWKFTICISKLDNGFVIMSRIGESAHAIEPSILDRIINRDGVLQVYRIRYYGVYRLLGCVRNQNEGS